MQLYLFREVRQFFTGVDGLNGSEHFDCMKLFVLGNIEKVLERYNTLFFDNMLNINSKPIEYKL